LCVDKTGNVVLVTSPTDMGPCTWVSSTMEASGEFAIRALGYDYSLALTSSSGTGAPSSTACPNNNVASDAVVAKLVAYSDTTQATPSTLFSVVQDPSGFFKLFNNRLNYLIHDDANNVAGVCKGPLTSGNDLWDIVSIRLNAPPLYDQERTQDIPTVGVRSSPGYPENMITTINFYGLDLCVNTSAPFANGNMDPNYFGFAVALATPGNNGDFDSCRWRFSDSSMTLGTTFESYSLPGYFLTLGPGVNLGSDLTTAYPCKNYYQPLAVVNNTNYMKNIELAGNNLDYVTIRFNDYIFKVDNPSIGAAYCGGDQLPFNLYPQYTWFTLGVESTGNSPTFAPYVPPTLHPTNQIPIVVTFILPNRYVASFTSGQFYDGIINMIKDHMIEQGFDPAGFVISLNIQVNGEKRQALNSQVNANGFIYYETNATFAILVNTTEALKARILAGVLDLTGIPFSINVTISDPQVYVTPVSTSTKATGTSKSGGTATSKTGGTSGNGTGTTSGNGTGTGTGTGATEHSFALDLTSSVSVVVLFIFAFIL